MRIAILCCVLVTTVRADPPSGAIVVIADDAAFRSALADALAASHARLAHANAELPGLGDVAGVSRDLADREHASAVVWLVEGDRGGTLIAYDRAADRVLVRSLPYASGEMTAPQAAEAARTTRTMLRALRVPDDDIAPRPPPVPPPAVTPPTTASVPDTLAIAGDGGVRVGAPGRDAGFAGSIGVIWRPDRIGAALAVRLAPAADVDAIAGRIADNTIAASVRFPIAASARLRVVPALGMTVHHVALDGMVAEVLVHERRFDPAAHLQLSGTCDVTPTFAVGLGVSVDGLLRRQTYTADGTEVLVVPRVQATVGILVVARIL